MVDYSKYVAYMNGEWIPSSELKVDVRDRGFRVGDTVFDVTRTFNGKSYKMKEHVDRLYRSLKYVRIDAGMSAEEMVGAERGCDPAEHPHARRGGRLHYLAGGHQGDGAPGRRRRSHGDCRGLRPIPWEWFARFYQEGAVGVIPKIRAYSSDSVDPKIKHHSRMNFNLAEVEAKDVHPDAWPIMTDARGNLTEGVGYNVFMVTDGVIRTPGDSSILQGVSRGAVFEFAEQLGLPLVEEELQPYDLYTSDEAFVASTPFCVLPVTTVDNRAIGDGKPGPVVQQLLAAWGEKVGVDIVDQAEQYLAKMS